MHRKLRFIFLAAILTGCRGTFEDTSLNVSESLISCGNEGGGFEVAVSGRRDWTTDNTADWISVRKTDDYAYINISRNNGAAREAVIGFRIDGEVKDEIRITQENSDRFTIDKDRVFIGYKGGVFTVMVTGYDYWTARTDSDWIHIRTAEGESPAEMRVEVERSAEATERSGRIVFECSGKVLEMTVLQDLSPFVEVEKELVAFDGDGGQSQVLYMSNTEVTTISGNDWIRLINTDGSIRKVSFEVKRNLEKTEREGTIRVISSKDEEIFRTIEIRQGPKIDHPKLGIAEGTYLEVSGKGTFTLHPVFEDMTDMAVTWESDDSSIADVDKDGNVTVHTGGRCTITARNSFHGVQASVTLNIRLKADGMTVLFGAQIMNENPVAVRFKGERTVIGVIMDPTDAYSGDLAYFSSDENVAEITGNTINCLNPGKTDIYIESLYQSLSQVYTLVVLE